MKKKIVLLLNEVRRILKMRMYAIWHVPHQPPFLEMFERSCAAGAGGTVGAGGTDVALGEAGAGGAGGAGVSPPAGV